MQAIEYKFTDGWTAQEEFVESVTVTDGTFVNRGYELLAKYLGCGLTTAAMQDGSGGGGDTVNLTFNVNTASIDVGYGIYLGGGVFGDAQAHAMSDDDNDGR